MSELLLYGQYFVGKDQNRYNENPAYGTNDQYPDKLIIPNDGENNTSLFLKKAFC